MTAVSALGQEVHKVPLWRRLWQARWVYLFMAPSLVLALMFTFYPTVASWYFSLLDWSGFGADRDFVGLANYKEVVTDPYFWAAFRRTFVFAAVAVPAQLVLAFLVALVLNDETIRTRSIFRTLFFLPVVTTTAIVGVIMGLLLNPFDGPVNTALLALGIIDRPIDFLGDPDVALWAVAGVWVWKWFGIAMIYWLVALQTVPVTLYEAARCDGAGRWQMHRRVTLPIIAPFAFIITLITFIGAFNVFPLVQAMTRGGPHFSTELVDLYIYRLAFAGEGQPQLGYASAVGVFFGVTVLALTLLQGWGLRRVNAKRLAMREGRR